MLFPANLRQSSGLNVEAAQNAAFLSRLGGFLNQKVPAIRASFPLSQMEEREGEGGVFFEQAPCIGVTPIGPSVGVKDKPESF
jgi:hypothetical protein